MLKIFYSNRIEQLYLDFKQNLYSLSSPFARRLIIVPTAAIKSWLLLKLAEDPTMGIAMGLEVLDLDEAYKKISELLTRQTDVPYYPSLLEITLAIEAHIRKIADSWNELPNRQKEQWEPLMDYLKIKLSKNPYKLNLRSEKRIATLSQTLGKIFYDYGKYGHAMLEKWVPEQGWQQALWIHLFSTWNKNWSYPAKEYTSLKFKDVSVKNVFLHIFSVSFMPASEFALIEKVSHIFPVHFYALSPCYHFWSDILSDGESKYVQQYWNRREVSEQEQNELEDYLRDKNTLLANWGKQGRKMAELLEKGDYETFTHYRLPENFQLLEPYAGIIDDSLIWEPTSHPPSLLDYIQVDLLTMRNNKTHSFQVPADESIQLHQSPNRQREIQILYHQLLYLIDKEQDIEPSDIIVMAPDIHEYAPYIQQFFGASDSLLDFKLMDLSTLSNNPFIQSFWQLVQLSFSRWNAEEILELFNNPLFQKRQRIEREDLIILRSWIEETQIRWGKDEEHRNEFLQQKYHGKMIEDTQNGTWEGGFARLLLGLTMDLNSEECSIAPFLNIENSQGILLGNFIKLLRQLKDDLKELSSGVLKTYEEWVETLRKLIITYLIEENELDEEEDDLFKLLETFIQATIWIPEHRITFSNFKIHLESYLKTKKNSYRENHLQSVRFCSMLPMRAIPAKIIALVGMHENAFPRMTQEDSLNLMKNNPSCDYRPHRLDYDRYLFLEAILSSRRYLIFSYPQYSSKDGKEQAPSGLITELMSYIQKSYFHEPQEVEKLIYSHPYRFYDAVYFSTSSKLKNFSLKDYQCACAYYKEEKKSAHQFIHSFDEPTPAFLNSKDLIIDIRNLKIAINNPIKHYLNQNLGMYISDEEDSLLTDEAFVIDPLQMHAIKKSSLSNPLSKCLNESEISGNLPLGVFKQTAITHIQNAINKHHALLKKLEVDPLSIFDIELSENITIPKDKHKVWQYSALEIEMSHRGQVSIVGRLVDVSEEGLLANISGTSQDLFKPWVEFVLLCYIIDLYSLPIKKQLLCLKTGRIKKPYFEDSSTELKRILQYYFETLDKLSPLSQEWLPIILKKENENIQHSIQKNLNDPFNPIFNPYLKWIYRTGSPDERQIQKWKSKAEEVFNPVYKAWTSKDESI